MQNINVFNKTKEAFEASFNWLECTDEILKISPEIYDFFSEQEDLIQSFLNN